MKRYEAKILTVFCMFIVFSKPRPIEGSHTFLLYTDINNTFPNKAKQESNFPDNSNQLQDRKCKNCVTYF